MWEIDNCSIIAIKTECLFRALCDRAHYLYKRIFPQFVPLVTCLNESKYYHNSYSHVKESEDQISFKMIWSLNSYHQLFKSSHSILVKTIALLLFKLTNISAQLYNDTYRWHPIACKAGIKSLMEFSVMFAKLFTKRAAWIVHFMRDFQCLILSPFILEY